MMPTERSLTTIPREIPANDAVKLLFLPLSQILRGRLGAAG
jgi:hypothetical protein